MKRIESLMFLLLLLISCDPDTSSEDPPEEEVISSVTDIDGNMYSVVQIGDQLWMAENLKVSRLNNGDPITAFDFSPDDDSWFWNSASTPMYTWASTADLNNLHAEDLPQDFYGALYSSGAIKSGLLAPEGWRIPTVQDYLALGESISSAQENEGVASALRSVIGWIPSNGTNSSGFAALPNGYCTAVGSATGAQAIATFGTSELQGEDRTLIQLSPQGEMLSVIPTDERFGSAIRCIKE